MKTEANEPITPFAGFPEEPGINASVAYGAGLTKREYFAAMAMIGSVGKDGMGSIQSRADLCVEYADALIHSLNK